MIPQQLKRLTDSGVLERLHHGLYRLSRVPHDEHLAMRVAWFALDPSIVAWQRLEQEVPTGVLSHRTAAELHRLGDPDADVVELTATRRIRLSLPDITVHRGHLTRDDWQIVDEVRLPDARYSKDIDLLVAADRSDAVETLRHVGRNHAIDHFLFEVGPPTLLSNGKGVTVRVEALLGGKVFDAFSIDLASARRELVGHVERRPIPRLVDTEDFSQEITAQLYPLADQIADKICAMYEIYGAVGAESGRYRDLVDLLLISSFLAIDLSSTVTALQRERALRGIPALPTTLESPGSTWPARWAATARQSPLAADYHDVAVALAAASRCYDRILGSLPAADHEATWSHERSTWEF